MEKWIEFFTSFFHNRDDAKQFVEPLEALALEDPRHPAKIMLHQTQRLISISDDLPVIRKGKESLQLAFLLICAENIAKMHDNFDEEGHSRAYVRRFFEQFLADDDRHILQASLTSHRNQPLDLRAIVDALYGVRCDVVHEGKYWDFHFSDGDVRMMNGDPDVIVSITLRQFRDIVVRGCIRAINTYPGRVAP